MSASTPTTGSAGSHARARLTGIPSHGPASHQTPSSSRRGGKKSGTAMLTSSASMSRPLVTSRGRALDEVEGRDPERRRQILDQRVAQVASEQVEHRTRVEQRQSRPLPDEPIQRDPPRGLLDLVGAASGRERRADDRAHARADDPRRPKAALGEHPRDADVGPAPTAATARAPA